jgi:hypothetical protein
MRTGQCDDQLCPADQLLPSSVDSWLAGLNSASGTLDGHVLALVLGLPFLDIGHVA